MELCVDSQVDQFNETRQLPRRCGLLASKFKPGHQVLLFHGSHLYIHEELFNYYSAGCRSVLLQGFGQYIQAFFKSH